MQTPVTGGVSTMAWGIARGSANRRGLRSPSSSKDEKKPSTKRYTVPEAEPVDRAARDYVTQRMRAD